ncbi:MAG: hypothetical protein WCU74_01195 [Candidatus Omnitrophota bacterium]|jgi:CMP-N-acetylneuraminic acid synthetase
MNYAVVIPAQNESRYHVKGDLAPLGHLSLLEWKIIQLKQVFNPSILFVASSAREIESICVRAGVGFILRKNGLPFCEVITEVVQQIKEEIVIWANVTAPFIYPQTYADMVHAFLHLGAEHDSLISVKCLNEYLAFDDHPINFNFDHHTERSALAAVHCFSNGCYIQKRKSMLERNTLFGARPFYYELDSFQALEVKDLRDLTVMNHLIAHYFSTQTSVSDD